MNLFEISNRILKGVFSKPGWKGKNCWKLDCDGSETNTTFTLQLDWDCSGKLTTVTEVANKNGQKQTSENASNCHGSQCQMPDCPQPKQCYSTS